LTTQTYQAYRLDRGHPLGALYLLSDIN